jgi:hypothetical protein
MAKMARNLTAGLTLLMLVAPGAARGADLPSRTIVVHVQNETTISGMALITAQMRAAAIFEAAGLSIEWLNDEREFKPIADPRVMHVRVIIAPDSAIRTLVGSQPPSRGTLGLALHRTKRVYLFGDRIRKQAVFCARIGLPAVLGRALAPELGHILLPDAGHSDTGIMRARLDFERSTDRLFTPEQVSAIHALLASHSHEGMLMAATTFAAEN